MMIRGATLVLLVALAGCNADTEVVVVVSAGDVTFPTAVDKVRIVVANTLASTPDLPICVGATSGCMRMPIAATLVPGPDHASDPVTVDVTAYLHDQPVIRDAATFVFTSGERGRLDFVLYQSCLGNLACADGTVPQSCGPDGQCHSLTVEPLRPIDGGAPDLARPGDLATTDLRASVDLATVDLMKTGDLNVAPTFAGETCVSANGIAISSAADTCAAYCVSVGLTCHNTCTTNRGLTNWGVEAWASGADCSAFDTSAGQAMCADDLSQFSDASETKYRCCCR